MKRTFKYLLLIVPGVLALYVIAPYGDHCSGLAHVMAWLLLTGFYALFFLGMLGLDLYRLIKRRQRVDLVPILITCLFLLLNDSFNRMENKKPWTSVVLRGTVMDVLGQCDLVLYGNGTFEACRAQVDWACTYAGRYTWNGSRLLLLREDLSDITDNTFATEYRLLLPDSMLIPLQEGSLPIGFGLRSRGQGQEGR